MNSTVFLAAALAAVLALTLAACAPREEGRQFDATCPGIDVMRVTMEGGRWRDTQGRRVFLADTCVLVEAKSLGPTR